jgi:hypothetical protein
VAVTPETSPPLSAVKEWNNHSETAIVVTPPRQLFSLYDNNGHHLCYDDYPSGNTYSDSLKVPDSIGTVSGSIRDLSGHDADVVMSNPSSKQGSNNLFASTKNGKQVIKSKKPLAKKKRTRKVPKKLDASYYDLVADDSERYNDVERVQWSFHYHEMLQFREEHGHGCVPYKYKPNQTLANWCKRQRYQYKLYTGEILSPSGEPKPSSLSEDRIKALDKLGFCWDMQQLHWDANFEKLKCVAAELKTMDIPKTNKLIGRWVHIQRSRYRNGELLPIRIRKLESIGFLWESEKRVKRAHKEAEETASNAPPKKQTASRKK